MIAERATVTGLAGEPSRSPAALWALLFSSLMGFVASIAVSAFSGSAGGGTAALLVGALVGTAAVAAVALVLRARATGTPGAPDAVRRRLPRGDVDPTTLIAQSHPDAAGHVRSRAPSAAAAAPVAAAPAA